MSEAKQIYGFLNEIYQYENFLENIYIKSYLSHIEEFQGFLIKLSDYDNFKKSICYNEILKRNYYDIKFTKDEFREIIYKYNVSISNIQKVEQVEIKNQEELINSIKNGEKYKIINKNLFKLICLKEVYSIEYTYYISNKNLKIFGVSFSHNYNALDELSYILGNEELEVLSNSIIEYYNIENQFDLIENTKNELNLKINNSAKKRKPSYDTFSINYFSERENLNLKSQNIFEGYLVDENWINEWKKLTNYNIIIEGTLSPSKEKRNEIMVKLYNSRKNNNKKIELIPIKGIYFDTKNEYENYLKYTNLVIVNINFYNYFIEKMTDYNSINIINKIKYSFHNNIITIYFNETLIDLISEGNIILKQTNANLFILKKINNFQEESQYLINDFDKIGMVEKNWIQELKNKYLYRQYSYIMKKYDVSKIIRTKEFSYLIKKIEANNEFDIKSKEKLKIMINSKKMKYISNFEIVNLEIISYLKILYNDFYNYYYEGYYYLANTQYSNIIISFPDNEGNYHYQIGKIDQNNIFNANYIFNFNIFHNNIYLLKNILLNNEDEFFNKIYYNNSNNEFIIGAKIKCFFYKLNFNDDLDCLWKLFVSISKFENLLKKQLIKKEVIYDFGICCLINKKFLKEFKDTFLYNYFLNDKDIFLKNKQNFINILLDKKINEILCKENYINIGSYLSIKNINFFYPYNFNIINDEIYNNLNNFSKFLNINISAFINSNVPVIINEQKIIMKIIVNGILIIKIDKNNELIPEKILEFNNSYIRDIRESYFKMFKNYKFKDIILDEVISFIYDKNNNISGYIYPIDNIENKDDNKGQKSISEEKIKNNLQIIIEFYRFNEYIMDKKNNIITITPSINEEELFIANKKWIDEFKYIFSYNEILDILKGNKDLILDEKEEKENIINTIYNNIYIQSKQILQNISNDIIQTKFNNINLYNFLYKSYDNDNNPLLYFNSCVIINKKLLDLLNVNCKVPKANIFFGDDKIFINLDNMVKIGLLKNNLFITEYIIHVENKETINKIKNIISIKGFEYINTLSKENHPLIIKDDNINLFTKTNKLNLIDYDDSNIKDLDEKLKILLILCIYQLKFKLTKNEKMNINDVFLLDTNFLSEINYYNLYNYINNIVDNNNDIKLDIKVNKIKEKEILYKLNKYINTNIFPDFENKLKNINHQNKINQSFYAKKIKLILNKDKELNVYNNFIIVNKNIMSLIRDIFEINIINDNNINISYMSSKEKEIILVKDGNQQYILLGNIMDNANSFKLEYIFDYKDKNNIKSEINKLIYDYDMYFKNIIIFNDKYENDYISPIFSENKKEIIGYCYKYSKDLKINDYTKFSFNVNLRNIIQIYIYNSILINDIIKKENLNLLNEFYIINHDFLKEFKIINNYEMIKAELNKMKTHSIIIENIYKDLLNNKICMQNTKCFYSLFKYLNPNINIKLNDKKGEIKIDEKKLNSETRKINYFDINSQENKIITIDNHFELMHKNIISLFINNNLSKNQVIYDIINDYILVNYPKRIYENNQFITLIGKCNNESVFTPEYVLIYYSDVERIKHLKLLKKYLSNYLKGISFINNNAPILNDEFEIIGIIIKNDSFIIQNSNTDFIKKYNELEIKYSEEKGKNNNLSSNLAKISDLFKKEKDKNFLLINKINEISKNNLNKESLLKEEISKNKNLESQNNELTKELKNIKLNFNDLQKKNNELVQENQNLNLNNNLFMNNIKKAKEELENEKDNNKNLEKRKIELEEIISIKEAKLNENKIKFEELNKKKIFLENLIESNENDTKSKLIKLYEELKSKENEIKEIESRYPVSLSKGEKLICVIFMSTDQSVHYPIICKASELFTKLEELLYEKYPELSEKDNIFLANGSKINRFKTIESNGIKYGDIITFFPNKE